MNSPHEIRSTPIKSAATWVGAALGIVCALLAAAHASDHEGRLTEEFHQSYTVTADARIELENINGPVHITGWDGNQVKVDAVKYANSQDRLDDASIVVDAGKDYVSIRTKYRDHDQTWNRDGWDNPASVEYTLMVPRTARLDEIRLINGSLDVQNVKAEVRAECINGKLTASGLDGRAKLETINGRLSAAFDHLGDSPLELSSVNGEVELTLPSDVKAEVEASTVHGGIDSDFGLHARSHQWVGHDLRGELGGGGTRIKLSNVNGRIEIRHANDGRALSPAKDLNRGDCGDDDDEI
jgi:putative adhesin